MNSRGDWKRFWSRFGCEIFLLVLMFLVIGCGIQVRRWAWHETKDLRFRKDIINGFYWGSESVYEGRKLSGNLSSRDTWPGFFTGYFAVYDEVEKNSFHPGYHLDYPPLRLLVMSLWAKHVLSEHPEAETGRAKFLNPLVFFNLLCEIASAVAIFLLVRQWLDYFCVNTKCFWLRGIPPRHHGSICGMAAASVAWLEPSLILDAHVWPQWDVWCLPFYLFAALAALNSRWLWCGCLLAVGAMLKGQIMMVAPFFVMWPLWGKQWGNACRVMVGFVAAAGFITSPWLLRNFSTFLGVGLVMAAIIGVLVARKFRNSEVWFFGMFAIAVFLGGLIGGGSFAWLRIGLLYGTEQYPYLTIGSCYNLPALLAAFHWSLKDALWSHGFGSVHLVVTLQLVLRLIYMTALGFCAFGAARHSRNRSPRLLIALITPWLLMFAILGQMHERYLMWGAIASAVAFGVNARLSVLHFVLSVASSVMILRVMILDGKIGPTFASSHLLDQFVPYASSLVLLCVAIYFWESIYPKCDEVQRTRGADVAQISPQKF